MITRLKGRFADFALADNPLVLPLTISECSVKFASAYATHTGAAVARSCTICPSVCPSNQPGKLSVGSLMIVSRTMLFFLPLLAT